MTHYWSCSVGYRSAAAMADFDKDHESDDLCLASRLDRGLGQDGAT